MIRLRRRGLTMLEVMIAGLVLSTIVAGSYSLITSRIAGVRITTGSDEARLDARNALELIRSVGFDQLLTVCGSINPCNTENSSLGNLLPSDLQEVKIEIQFEDETGAMSSAPTYARISVTGEDGSIYYTGLVQRLNSPMSNYGFWLDGTIRDDLGQPISDVSVSVQKSDGTVMDSITTDPLGYYRFRLVRGIYKVAGTKTHYTSVEQGNVLLDGSRTVDLIMERRFTVSGTISDDLGMPIQGVFVSLSGGLGGPYSTTTDSNGSFTLTNIRPGIYTVSLSKPNYESKTTNLAMSPHPHVQYDATLERRITLTGTVGIADVFNSAIPGATVRITGMGADKTTVTDGSGTYSFADLRPGNYTIQVSADGYVGVTQTYNIQNHPTHILNFKLDRATATLTGRVTNDLGVGISGATVYLTGVNGNYTTLTDANGYYSITGIIPGTYLFRVTKINHVEFTQAGTAIGLPSAKIDVTLERRLRLNGTVTREDTGAAVLGARVTLSGGPGGTYVAYTDISGKYTITDVVPGNYGLSVTLTGYQDWSGGQVMDADKTRDMALKPLQKYTVFGETVVNVDARRGSPFSGAGEYKFFFVPPEATSITIAGSVHARRSLLAYSWGAVDIWSSSTTKHFQQFLSAQGQPVGDYSQAFSETLNLAKGRWYVLRAYSGRYDTGYGQATLRINKEPITVTVNSNAPTGTYNITIEKLEWFYENTESDYHIVLTGGSEWTESWTSFDGWYSEYHSDWSRSLSEIEPALPSTISVLGMTLLTDSGASQTILGGKFMSGWYIPVNGVTFSDEEVSELGHYYCNYSWYWSGYNFSCTQQTGYYRYEDPENDWYEEHRSYSASYYKPAYPVYSARIPIGDGKPTVTRYARATFKVNGTNYTKTTYNSDVVVVSDVIPGVTFTIRGEGLATLIIHY